MQMGQLCLNGVEIELKFSNISHSLVSVATAGREESQA